MNPRVPLAVSLAVVAIASASYSIGQESQTSRTGKSLAFPTAEGYGRFAQGGRGGRVLHVINLNDSGPGSLRAAVETDGPRTVVFDVSGLITLESRLIIRKTNSELTIAGQTAPGKGICLRKYNMGMLGATNVIVRYIRVRPGNLSGMTLDGMGMASSDQCIIDHCSISWTLDESFSSRGGRNITLQRTLISEALNEAGHKKYPPGTQHGYAASIGGDIGSFHHNLLAHCAGRNWSLAGGLSKPQAPGPGNAMLSPCGSGECEPFSRAIADAFRRAKR